MPPLPKSGQDASLIETSPQEAPIIVPDGPIPSQAAPQIDNAGTSAAPSSNFLAFANRRPTGGFDSAVPNMVGDFFGSLGTSLRVGMSSSTVTFGPTPLTLQFVQVPGGSPDATTFDRSLSGGQVEVLQRSYCGRNTAVDGTFRTLDPVDGQPASVGSVFLADVRAVDGSGAADGPVANAYNQVVLISSDVASVFNAQKQGFINANGPGSFSGEQASDGLVTIDETRATVTGGVTPAGSVDANTTFALDQDITFTPPVVTFMQEFAVFVPPPSAGSTVGRVRLSDNNSALPQDRCFFDYNFFHSVPLVAGGMSVNRFVPGFEKKFLGGNASFEMRVPMAVTLDNKMFADGATELTSVEMGNVGLATKFLLLRDRKKSIAMGLGLSLPTADNTKVSLVDGTPLIRVVNEAVHITPYVAALFTPTRDVFVHAFLHCDFDTGGDTVLANPVGAGLAPIGVWNDQTYLYADLGLGKWIFRNDSACRGLSGVAITGEAHYTNAITDADSVNAGNLFVGNPLADIDMLNGTVGAHLRFGRNTTTTTAYSFPSPKTGHSTENFECS